ncbi:MAG: glycosyltransferase [Kiritimatiellae bacterium]|nr:glycosyltransferase [Kiritimatiellia bacterium]
MAESKLMTSRNMTDVAVLIVTYKRNDLLSKCLESIERQYGAELQIVVVDNGAEAAAKEICDRWQNVSYIETETNCGFAGGNNIGWKTIDRKYVVLVNNDYVPSPHVMHVGGGTSGKVNWSLVLERYYRNIFFSVLTCFGVYGLCRFLPVLTGLCLGQSRVALCRDRPGVLLSHLRNVVRFRRERKLIAVTRRAVRSREVRSDREIIRIAVRRQPWTCYKELMTR